MPGIMRWVKVLFWQSVVLERVLKKLGTGAARRAGRHTSWVADQQGVSTLLSRKP